MCCGPHIRPGCVLRKSPSLKPWLYWEDGSEVFLEKRITEHEKEEHIDLQPSLVLDWELSQSQNINKPTELKGVLLY